MENMLDDYDKTLQFYSFLHFDGLDFRLYDSSDLKTYGWSLIFGCCQAHRGLPVGFFLLLYSVLCTVESLSLLYLLFIS